MISATRADEITVDWLRVTQSRASLEDLTFRDPDLVLIFSSAEPRCLAPIRTGPFQASNGLLVLFTDGADNSSRRQHDIELRRWLAERCSEVSEISDFASIQWRECSEAILKNFALVSGKLGRPIRIAIDISCCPKAQFLPVIATAISAGLVSKLVIFYSSAVYKQVDNGSLEGAGEEALFSKGRWRPAMIPFLEGELRPGRRRTIVASLGYESQKSRFFIRNYQPDRCIFVIPEVVPDDQPHLKEIAQSGPERHRALFSDFDAPAGDVVSRPAGDVVGIIDFLRENEERWQDDEVMLFALGTKPHALGFALHAIARPGGSVIPRVPDEFVAMGNEADGYGWLYVISDMSAPR